MSISKGIYFYFFLTLLNIVVNFSFGQNYSSQFTHFSTLNGVPSSELYSVLQDSKGNMWFGSDRGLVKYNGYEFITFTSKDGLADNTVFKLFEDVNGRIWMLTFSGRIFYLQNNHVYPYKFNNIVLEKTQTHVPHGFYIDSLENVSVMLRGLGELIINHDGVPHWKFTEENLSEIHYVIDEITPSDILFTIMDHVFKQKINILHHSAGRNNTLSLTYAVSDRFVALKLKNNKLIFSIGNSIFEEVNGQVNLLSSLKSKIYFITQDRQGDIWAGTENGVHRFNQSDFSNNVQHYLEEFNVTCVCQDREGGYWFTTLDNGIFYMPGYGIEAIEFNNGILQKPISLTSDNSSSVYVGCWNGSVVELKDRKGRLLYSPGETGFEMLVTNLTTFPGDEKIYLSRTDPGYLFRNQFHPFKFKHSFGIKTDYIHDSDGNLFAAGSQIVFISNADSMIQYSATGQRINCLERTRDGELLIGSNLGVFVVDKLTKNISNFHSGFTNIRVDDLEWFKDFLIIATKGKGILIFGKDSIFQIDESKGLCSDLVNKILVSGNRIWCTSNRGISRIIINNEINFNYTISNIHNTDGLLSDEISDIAILHDTIYVSSNSGISFFNSETDFVNHEKPEITITAFHVNNAEVSINDNLELKRNSNNIRIRFNGISYRSKEKLKYSYELENKTDTFSSITANREVEFLSLEPGVYTFKVSSINNSELKSIFPATITFSILPAWWQTKLFKLLMTLFAIALIYLFYKYRVRSLKEKFDSERHQASLQLTAMRSQMNPHFIFNVMNSIRNYMQDHDLKSAEKYLISFSKLVRYTLDNSDIPEVTLEEELNALRNYTELEMQRFDNSFEFNICCQEGIDTKDTMLPSLLLQPIVENAIKHGISGMKTGGKILIEIKKSNSKIIIAIEDNGIGIQNEKGLQFGETESHIPHGTTLTMERIKAYNKAYNRNIIAKIIDINKAGGNSTGTRVEIEI